MEDDRDKLVKLYEDQIICDEHWRMYDAIPKFHKVRDYERIQLHHVPQRPSLQQLRELVSARTR